MSEVSDSASSESTGSKGSKVSMIMGSLVAGLLVAAAAPPFDLWPLSFLAIALLHYANRENGVFGTGACYLLCFGVVFGISCFWWQPTLMRFGQLSSMKATGLLALLVLWQAIPYALWGTLAAFSRVRFKVSALLVLPLWFGLIESLAPFPFKHYLAITVWRSGPLIQFAEWGGPVLVYTLVVFGGVLLAEVIAARRSGEGWQRIHTIALSVFCGFIILGSLRMWQVDRQAGKAPAISVGVVQPNFGNATTEERERYGAAMLKQLRKASETAGAGDTRLVVWPETAWPYLFDRNLEREFPKGHPWALRKGFEGSLLFGALSHNFDGDKLYNSAVLVAQDGAIKGRHDKQLLVPFAEYIPFETRYPEWAASMRERLSDKPDITRGGKPEVMEDGELRIGALICSEDLDSDFTAQLSGANLLVTIASDAWFGISAAPHQHLALACFRAVENRRALVRAANTGVSGLISPTGKLLAQTELVQGSGDASVQPMTLKGEVPLMSSAGMGKGLRPLFPWLCVVGLVLAIIRAR